MNDALTVRRVQCIGDLNGQVQNRFDVNGLACNQVLEGLPFQTLHGHERRALVLAEVINGADIRMVQCRGSLRFALEALQSLRVLGELFRQEFQRNEPVKSGVLSLEHHTHPATT